MPTLYERPAGIDVAKARLDYYLLPEERGGGEANEEGGIERLVRRIQSAQVTLVCLEATGGYERPLVAALHQAGVPVAVVNPRLPRDFARAQNALAKTDRLDARNLARFAERMQPKPTEPESPAARELRALVARRDQLNELLGQERNRLEHADDELRESHEQTLDFLRRQLRTIDERIARKVAENASFREMTERLESVPGLGPKTAAALVAELPELGRINRRQIARLVGVAPINRDSGTLRGKRTTGGGRASLRRKLYMPTLVAVRHNPRIRNFYQHLLRLGKPKMVALVACMRKLLTILNTLVRNKTSWNITTQNA